jgi:hypothetical protein
VEEGGRRARRGEEEVVDCVAEVCTEEVEGNMP